MCRGLRPSVAGSVPQPQACRRGGLPLFVGAPTDRGTVRPQPADVPVAGVERRDDDDRPEEAAHELEDRTDVGAAAAETPRDWPHAKARA